MRLIDADELVKKFCDNCPGNDCKPDATDTVYGCEIMSVIDDQPTIEPEVRRGRWKKKNGEIYCTNCKKSKWSESFELMLRRFNYCPHCGAKMDGGE